MFAFRKEGKSIACKGDVVLALLNPTEAKKQL